MTCRNSNNRISNGQYVIIQRKDYNKLHLFTEKSASVFIGKDKIELDAIRGEKSGSVFKMVPKVGCNRQFTLQGCSTNDAFSGGKSLIKGLGKGQDNRILFDTGLSQSLTSNCIEELRDVGTSPKEIIEQLVGNSKTFQIKTEFSQEKYIDKKEKKYFEFITVRYPTLRLLAELFYSRDLLKSIGIRIDTLSQIVTMLNFQSNGSYLLLENGFSGIVAAFLLNSLSNHGQIVNVTSSNQQQKQAVLAMNFPSCKIERLVTVRLSTLSDFIHSASKPTSVNNECLLDNCEKGPDSVCSRHYLTDSESPVTSGIQCSSQCAPAEINSSSSQITTPTLISSNTQSCNKRLSQNAKKRKNCNLEDSGKAIELKKPRWELEAELASDILLKKVDGIMIACKEYPLHFINAFLDYLLPSRPIVVYSLHNEPLVALYSQLKQRNDIVCLKITETWLRPYQVLPERSHPSVTISPSSGFLLSGIKVNK